MKHLLVFFLIALLILLLLFVILCLDVSFGEHPSLAFHYCSTHDFLSIELTLPTWISSLGNEISRLIDRLPNVLTAPPRFVLGEIGALLGGMRDAYLHEVRACTAFR